MIHSNNHKICYGWKENNEIFRMKDLPRLRSQYSLWCNTSSAGPRLVDNILLLPCKRIRLLGFLNNRTIDANDHKSCYDWKDNDEIFRMKRLPRFRSRYSLRLNTLSAGPRLCDNILLIPCEIRLLGFLNNRMIDANNHNHKKGAISGKISEVHFRHSKSHHFKCHS